MRNRNLKFLKLSYPDLYKQIQSLPPLPPLEPAKQEGEFTIRHKGQYLHSRYSPVKESLKKKLHLSLKKNGPVFFLAPALGYDLMALFPYLKNREIHLVEQDLALLNCSLSVTDYRSLAQNNTLIFHYSTPDPSSSVPDPENLTVIKNRIIIENEPSEFYTLWQNWILQGLKNRIADLSTSGYFSPIWYRNTLLNLLKINSGPDLSSLKNKFQAYDAILAGGGPSLEESIPLIRKFTPGIILLSAATALKPLLRQGITPHFVLNTDGGFFSYWHTKNSGTSSPLLISSLYSHYLTSSTCGFRQTFFDPGLGFSDPFINQKNHLLKLPMTSTVTAAGVHFLNYLGVKRIFLAGQDFGYPGYRTHCRGTIHEVWNLQTQTRVRPADTADSVLIFSEKTSSAKDHTNTRLLTGFKHEQYAREFSNFSLNLYSLSPSSRKIPGIPSGVPDTPNPEPPEKLIKSLPAHKKIHLRTDQALQEIQSIHNSCSDSSWTPAKAPSLWQKALFSLLEADFIRSRKDPSTATEITKKTRTWLSFTAAQLARSKKS